jgi:hypothetical protein
VNIEFYDKLADARRVPVTRVVIYDDFDNPICVCMKMQTGRITVVRAGDKRFNEVLRMLGVRRTVIVDNLDTNTLPPLSVR